MRIRQEKSQGLSIAYLFFITFIGLAITGLIALFLSQYLGITFHYIVTDLSSSGTDTLNLLDSLLAFMPIAIVISSLLTIVVYAYKARYQV